MSLRQNNWTLGAYCQSYCGFVNGHHSPGGRQRLPAPAPRRARCRAGARPARGRARRHPRPLDEVDRVLVALVRDADEAALDAVEEALRTLGDRLLSHLAYEERELRGPLARHGFY